MDEKLVALQMFISRARRCKIDIYRQEGYGALVVEHGKPLIPENVIYALSDYELENLII